MSDLNQRVLYSQVVPQSVQSVYTQDNAVDFILNCGEGRSIAPNSVRVLGNLNVYVDNATTRPTGGVHYDPKLGAHAFVSSVAVNFSMMGGIENISQSYPRYVAAHSAATLTADDMMNSTQSCEIRTPNVLSASVICSGVTPSITTGTAQTRAVDFSFKPKCCLNMMDSDSNGLPAAKTGAVRLQLVLARNVDALYGSLQDAAVRYELTDLRCSFKTVVDNKANEPVTMGIVNSFKSNVLNGTATITTNVDAMAESVSMSFIKNEHESANVFNSYGLEKVEGLTEISYLFNSVSNSLITYPITDVTEILARALDAIDPDTDHNQVSLNRFRTNNAFLAGIKFDEAIDLSSNRFTMMLTSGILPTSATNVFMYFYSRRSI